MDKVRALSTAIELAKISIESTANNSGVYPTEKNADEIADFIEKLASRLVSL